MMINKHDKWWITEATSSHYRYLYIGKDLHIRGYGNDRKKMMEEKKYYNIMTVHQYMKLMHIDKNKII